jgi:thiamine-monophosphate kinase
VRESLYLQEHFELHAGIDVSDGLSLDVSRIAKESGCGAELRFSDIPIDPAAVKLSERASDGNSPLDHALGDGEDFELVLAAPPGEAERMTQTQPLSVPVRCIGRFVSEPGLWSILPDGQRRPLVPRGYEHPLT